VVVAVIILFWGAWNQITGYVNQELETQVLAIGSRLTVQSERILSLETRIAARNEQIDLIFGKMTQDLNEIKLTMARIDGRLGK